MKIGFLARTGMILERYWEKLHTKADCWWGVTQQPLYDALKAKKHTKIIFHLDKQVVDKSKNFGNKLVSVNPGESENKVAQDINPDLWITESLNKLSYVPKKSFWIQPFYSLPIKKHFFYPPVLDYDLMLLPGEYHKAELIKRLRMKDDDERLKVVGWPHIDDFFNNVFNREEIMNDLGLNTKRKTLLYAPTWGWGYGNETFFARWLGNEIEVFEKLCRKAKEMELNFIVKLHSLSFHAGNEEIRNIAHKYGVVWVTKETSGFQLDPNPFLWITDVLISDVSGIIANFLALNRPIIYIDPDEKLDAWNGADMPKHFRAGHVVRTPAELIGAVHDSVNHPERFKEERQRLISKLFHSPDGKALDRAVSEILTFAESRLSCSGR